MSLTKYKKSNKCRLCSSRFLKKIYDFEKIPVGEKYFSEKKKYKKIIQFPMTLYRCSNCYNIQISEVVDPEFLWSNYTYLSGQTQSIKKHFLEFYYNLLKKSFFKYKKNDLIIDIGSNDGSLLQNFKSNKFRVLGIDPALNIVKIANRNKINTIHGLFNLINSKKILNKYGKAKIITAFNVFAHTDKMKETLISVRNVLDEDGVFIFEVQYLKDILQKNILGTFFHEHMCHYSVTTLKKFFDNNNMKLIDIEKVNIQKGSIIGYVTHNKSSLKIKKSVNNFIKKEQINNITKISTLNKFFAKIKKDKLRIKEILSKINYNGDIIAYGAARSGPTLAYNYGLRNKIKVIIDDHFMKINKYSPLDCAKVISSKQIDDYIDNPIVILAYIHAKKIIIKHKNFIKKGGNFIILFPQIKLVNNKNLNNFLS